MSKGLLLMPNVFEFSVDDERMNAFTNFLSQTNKSKNSQKICKKAHPWAPFNYPTFLHMKLNPFKCFRNPLQCSIHRLKFQKPFQDFRVQDCSFRNHKLSHTNSNQNLSHIHYRFEAQCQSNVISSSCSM